MELLGMVEVPLWFILLISCFLLLYLYSIRPFSFWKNLDVDGPKPVPFFGNAFSFFDPKVGTIKTIEFWKQQYGDFVGCYIFRKPTLVIRNLDVLKDVFVKQYSDINERFFVGNNELNNRIIRKGLFFEAGSDWHRIRRIMSPTFSTGKLKQVVVHMNRNAVHLADNVHKSAVEQKSVSAKDIFGAFALDSIAAMAFGLDINSQGNFDLPFIKNAKSLLTFKKMAQLKLILAGIFPPTVSIFEYFELGIFDSYSCEYFEKSIYNILDNRKDQSDGASDFLQFLLNAEADQEDDIKEKKLSLKEIASQCILFIIAGYETTSTTLQYLFYEIAKNTFVQDRLLEEIQEVIGNETEPTYEQIQNMKYMSAVISETLRMYPPVHMLTRQVTSPCMINGIQLPKGVAIMIPLYNIGRDPENFTDPDAFKPERFLNDDVATTDISFLPFGFGPRRCIGQRLAMMEIKQGLIHVLRRVALHDVSPKTIEFDDVTGLLVPKVPIELSFKVRE